MFKEAIDSLIDKDKELAKDAITREYEADTIYWLLSRLLSSAQQSRVTSEAIGVLNPMEITEYNLIAWYLEMIGDRLTSVCNNILKIEDHKKESDAELLERLGQLALVSFTMFDKAMKSIVERDITLASDAVDLYEVVEQEENKLLNEFQRTNSELSNRFNMIAWEFKIIAEHSSAIAEISIDIILQKENDICKIEEPMKNEK